MRLVFALLLCLVPATTFALPVQLSLSGTITARTSNLVPVVDVGDPFSALLTYDLPPGATSTSVSGFLYYKGQKSSFMDHEVGMTNGFPTGSAGEIFTEFNIGGLVDLVTYNVPVEFAPGRFSIVMSNPTTFTANLSFRSFFGFDVFTATGTVTPVPEPTTIGLLATGLAIGAARQLRKSKAGR